MNGTPTVARARRARWQLPAAAIAVLFGIASVVAGGRVIFGSAAARAAEGDLVPFVLWFNFVAAFFYIVAGLALALDRPWAARLALALAAGNALIYAAFGVHVLAGGAFTSRTAIVMALRTLGWISIALLACRRSGCRRPTRPIGVTAILTFVIVGATCSRPHDTVSVHAPAAPAMTGRAPAPRMTVKDHKGRELELPVPGRITVLSFASRATADLGSQRCRELRVAQPDVELVELMNVSSAPSFLASRVAGKLAERHDSIVADTIKAFADAHRSPPPDLDARIHIIADWSGDAFKAYRATDTDRELEVAVIDGAGGLVAFFVNTPTAPDLDAAVARAREPR